MLISNRLSLLADVLKVPLIIFDSVSPLTLFFLVRASVCAAAMAWSSESFRASFEMLLVLLKPQQPSTRTLIPQPAFSTTLILSSSPLIKLTSLDTDQQKCYEGYHRRTSLFIQILGSTGTNHRTL